jgi:hypothetical protein
LIPEALKRKDLQEKAEGPGACREEESASPAHSHGIRNN